MSVFVVDVSVALKWMLPEPLSTEAVRLQSPAHQLHAPSFFEVELANVLWKKVRQGGMSRAQADRFLGNLPGLPLARHADATLIADAFDLADRTSRTVYDCMYLALAVRLGGQLVTADERFVNSLANTPWAASAIRLQDVL
jgi:predicted nucleic acid-binding protein